MRHGASKITAFRRARRFSAVAIALLPSFLAASEPVAPDPTPEQIDFFERRVRPLLVEHCDECHGAATDEPGGGLRLTSRESLLRGGDSGPAAVPGAPDESRLVRAVSRTDPLLQMPPEEELTTREVATLVEWVRMGVPDPRADAAASSPTKPASVAADASDWWAFQPVAKPAG
jgi:hypothetical protein